jgi:hypothetical protein
MSQKSSAPLSKFNIALALLWLVDVVVTGVGYYILTTSNAAQADFYTSQSADYVSYFGSQSGSNLGATLIGAGVIGIIITLAVHALSRSISTIAATATSATALGEDHDVDFTDIDFDDSAAHDKAAVSASTSTGTSTSTSTGTSGDDTTSTDTGSTAVYGAAAAAPAPTAVFTDADDASTDGPTTTR